MTSWIKSKKAAEENRQHREDSAMKPTRAVEAVLDAALKDIRDACLPLRKAGWPANISVVSAEPHEDHFYDVVVRVRIKSPCKIPNEARQEKPHHTASFSQDEGRTWATPTGIPPDLAALLRDATIVIQRDHEIRLADGSTLAEALERWRNAPSNTASADLAGGEKP